MFVEKRILFARHVADGANSKGLQFLLGYLADAGNVSHVKGRKESCLLSGHHIEHTMWLGFAGTNFRNQARRTNSDRTVELRFRFHPLVQFVGGQQWRTVQSSGA